MNPLILCRHDHALLPESERVIIRSFIPYDPQRITTILGRALSLTESEVTRTLSAVKSEFQTRHFDIDKVLLLHFNRIQPQIFTQKDLSHHRKLLIGAMFSGEYALESAALFNPSIVPHPDQTNLAKGALRFILSLRATGEGHISSIEFRSGVLTARGELKFDPVSRFVTAPEILPNPAYRKRNFLNKLKEMAADFECCSAVMAPLEEWFTLQDLKVSIEDLLTANQPATLDFTRALERIQWLADSNYELRFSPELSISERILFPVSANESNGIEDARFVRFVEDSGVVTYYATYTAYNGRSILPQLIETSDFLDFRILTLSGNAVQNKGMALFPRQIRGEYLMLSRQDDENLYLMRSENPHHWDNPEIILRPAEIWESVKIGNCGSPLETEAGWLVITHGVGPMRKYCIGAVLLDLDDPTQVIGRLREPLLAPEGNEREGYVPNVVYSCGAMIHEGQLILPYAMSDRASTIVSLPVEELLTQLKK